MGGNEAQPRLSATVHWSTHMPQHAALLDCRGEIAGRLLRSELRVLPTELKHILVHG